MRASVLATIPGIGPLAASALVASVADASSFKNGENFAAFIGLVPKQSSSGVIAQIEELLRSNRCGRPRPVATDISIRQSHQIKNRVHATPSDELRQAATTERKWSNDVVHLEKLIG